MGNPLTFNQLQGIPDEGAITGSSGDDDFLGKINNIITGINTLFVNYQQLRGNISAQSPGNPRGTQDGKPSTGMALLPDQVLKIVDQRLWQLVTKTFSNQVFNMPINQLIKEYGDQTIVQAMEGFAKEGPQPE